VILALVALVADKYEASGLPYSSLSQGEKIAVNVNLFDNEVTNGGFHQFFTNPSGDLWPEILQSLRTIGATRTVALYERALSVFPDGQPSRDGMERWRQVKDAGEEATRVLYRLDDEYYTQKEQVYELAAEYVKTRKSEFL
jgi:hypothetical protein